MIDFFNMFNMLTIDCLLPWPLLYPPLEDKPLISQKAYLFCLLINKPYRYTNTY